MIPFMRSETGSSLVYLIALVEFSAISGLDIRHLTFGPFGYTHLMMSALLVYCDGVRVTVYENI